VHFTWGGKEFIHNFGGGVGASGKLSLRRQTKYRRIILKWIL
jgi:hypothetical protein